LTQLDNVDFFLKTNLGDPIRLTHIKNSFENDKPLSDSDKDYLKDLSKESRLPFTDETNTNETLSKNIQTPEPEKELSIEEKLKIAEQKISKLENKTKKNEIKEYRKNFHKSESTTLILSLVFGLIGLNGVGHIYVGKVGKGISILIGSIIIFGAGFAFLGSSGWFLFILYFLIFIWQITSSRKLCQYYNGYVSSTGNSPF